MPNLQSQVILAGLSATHSTKDLYELYVEIGKKLYESMSITNEELLAATEEATWMGSELIDEYFCSPEDNVGDKGFTACYVYEMREIAAGEKEHEVHDAIVD